MVVIVASLVILLITVISKDRITAIVGCVIDVLMALNKISSFAEIMRDSSSAYLTLFAGVVILSILVCFTPLVCAIIQIVLFNRYKPGPKYISVKYLDELGRERYEKFSSEEAYKNFVNIVIPRGYRIIGAWWTEDERR